MRKGNHLPLEELAPYLLEAPREPVHFKWSDVFGNLHPVEIEVGFGKGAFLVATAQDRPDVNFLGIEVDRGLQLYVANRVAKRCLQNIRLIKADAGELLRSFVSLESVAAIHVYFPDPWWKRRHKKRRVFTAEFAKLCERAVMAAGQLHIATDVEDYFGVMTKLVREHTQFEQMSDGSQRSVETNFERKAREQGRDVWRVTFVKPTPLRVVQPPLFARRSHTPDSHT